jgi:regulator of sigma D
MAKSKKIKAVEALEKITTKIMNYAEWCDANDISRPGSLSAQEAYKVYLSKQGME